MEDPWELANGAFHTGHRAAATRHLRAALSSAETSLERAIHHVNQHAIATYTATAPAPPLPTTASSSLAIVLLTEETALTAVYNATLRALRDRSDVSLAPLERACHTVFPVLALLLGDRDAVPVVPEKKPVRVVLRAINRLPALEELSKGLVTPIRRWADAAASCLDLLSAAHHLNHTPKSSYTKLSSALRGLITTLSTAVEHDVYEQYDAHTSRTNYLHMLHSPSPTYDDTHLPTLYLLGVQRLLKRDPSAKRLLETTAARSYRLADCLSLLARLERGDGALLAWQRAFAVDVRRPNGLWLAAREFARVGRYEQQATILSCLEQLLGRGVEEYSGVKIEPAMMEMDDFGEVVTKSNVAAERARALGAAGEWEEAAKVFGRLGEDVFVRADVLRDRALCAICEGRVSEGMSLAETAKAASAGPSDSAGALLVQAEGLLRTEEVTKAREKLMESFREARLGLVGLSETDAPRLLRGVCFHNLAVLHYCIKENVAADECFAAAETAFRKCEDECSEVASKLRVLSAYGRCLVMWGRGMKEDAAEYWRSVRELSIAEMTGEEEMDVSGDDCEDDRPTSHVVCKVDEQILQRFDRVCLGICREVEKRKEMERLVEEVEKEWPLGQKRRKPN